LFSIITVNRNNCIGLERTIASVESQTAKNFEYIVIDGASEDGSLEVIRRHEEALDYWVSEPDSGIYAAMNKGIGRARGDYLLFLNSGDWLLDDAVIERLSGVVDGNSDVYYSNLTMSAEGRSWIVEYPETVDVNYFIRSTISHQNSLIRKTALVVAGCYREDFRISADWYFYLCLSNSKKDTFRHIDTKISAMSLGGIGNDPRYVVLKNDEYRRSIREIFGQLADSLIELRAWRDSDFGYVVSSFGRTRLLGFLISAYRFFARRLSFLKTAAKSP
jgi:glycosyltransferase involved in cell wall biosynthesis